MKDIIEFVETHTNNEASEEAAQAGLMTFIAAIVIYCVALLV